MKITWKSPAMKLYEYECYRRNMEIKMTTKRNWRSRRWRWLGNHQQQSCMNLNVTGGTRRSRWPQRGIEEAGDEDDMEITNNRAVWILMLYVEHGDQDDYKEYYKKQDVKLKMTWKSPAMELYEFECYRWIMEIKMTTKRNCRSRRWRWLGNHQQQSFMNFNVIGGTWRSRWPQRGVEEAGHN